MFEDLEQIVDKKFWNRINDLRVHAAKKKRIPFLEALKVHLKQHEYFPSLPITVKETNKGHGVARQIPIFNLSDYSVYYYCVRKLEHVIAKNRVLGTYGGWSMGGKIRKQEDEEPGDPYQMTYSYNPAAWAKHYGDFNGRIYGNVKKLKSEDKTDYLVYEIDIANFYDNIQHPILENKIRRDADYTESGVLDLLMYFLGYSNRHVTQYNKRTVGIPQDAFGDCSRLLANYYLQDYDLYISELAKQHDSIYLRYADDQLFFVPNNDIGEKMIQMASRRLSKLGLNINQKKVAVRTLRELYTYRSFNINNIFVPKGSSQDKSKINEFATKSFAAIDKDVEALKDKGYPLIKRLVSADFNKLSPDLRARLMMYIFDRQFILSVPAITQFRSYIKMNDTEKSSYIEIVNELVSSCRHSSFHYEVLAFYRMANINTDALESRIAELRQNLFEVA